MQLALDAGRDRQQSGGERNGYRIDLSPKQQVKAVPKFSRSY
jgi:hypothetical protein